MEQSNYLLEMKNITKIFPGVRALDEVSFDLKPGEVHILLGENGAGKSTLMKVLAGAYTPDGGELFVEGEKVTQFSPISAQKLGIGIIYQEFNLVPYLSVAENIFIDHMPKKKGGVIDHRSMHEQAAKLLAQLNMKVDTHACANSIPVAQQQMVEVAKALTHDLKILIMDEPTSSLSDREIEQLFVTIRSLTAKGIGVIYISHRLQEIPLIGDRITILRDGTYVGTEIVKEITTQQMIKMMVGREIENLYVRDHQKPGEIALQVEHLSSKKNGLSDISMTLCRGEIVGLSGLVGAGRTELARTVFHVDSYEEGTISIFGEELAKNASPSDVIKKGLSLIPEDRKRQGLSLILPISQNVVMASLKKLFPRILVSAKKEKEIVQKYIDELRISTPGTEQLAQNLSGGNQQKVVLAKWLCTEAEIIIFDEPTRGIDVGAKGEIYAFMNKLAKQGKAILMISSELPEIVGMSDRVYVMRGGRLVAELPREVATQELIISYAMDGTQRQEAKPCKK
jgi:ribose transport system ATP-binding protein